MVRRRGRRGRDGRDARRGLGPDQQDRAGGVIDDEPAGRAQAPGPEAGALAVARHHEQVGAG